MNLLKCNCWCARCATARRGKAGGPLVSTSCSVLHRSIRRNCDRIRPDRSRHIGCHHCRGQHAWYQPQHHIQQRFQPAQITGMRAAPFGGLLFLQHSQAGRCHRRRFLITFLVCGGLLFSKAACDGGNPTAPSEDVKARASDCHKVGLIRDGVAFAPQTFAGCDSTLCQQRRMGDEFCAGRVAEKQTMRLLMIAALSLLALGPGALAETAEQASPRSAAAQPPGLTQDDIVRQHPDWFSEAGIPYRPCPCSVVFPDGRHACIGLP